MNSLAPGQLHTLTSRRFPGGTTVELSYQIEGTECWVVDLQNGQPGSAGNGYALPSELEPYYHYKHHPEYYRNSKYFYLLDEDD